jgi:hypothetical protein
MANGGVQVCPVCGVKIIIIGGGDAAQNLLRDRVLFSTGAPGTRSDLWARVCRYANRPGCINKDGEGTPSNPPSIS